MRLVHHCHLCMVCSEPAVLPSQSERVVSFQWHSSQWGEDGDTVVEANVKAGTST